MEDGNKQAVVLPRKIRRAMLRHALEAYPLEACGIIGGNRGKPTKFYPAQNELKSSSRYRLLPEDLIAIVNEMDEKRESIWGIFHSHPVNDACPSAIDIKEAYYPEAYYLIASLQQPSKPVLRAFLISDGSVEEIELQEAAD